MTIYTRFIGPTNYRGARIAVWCKWSGDRKTKRIYPYEYGARDAHDFAVGYFLDDWQSIAQEIGLSPYTNNRPPAGPWSIGESEDGKGYIYTNSATKYVYGGSNDEA